MISAAFVFNGKKRMHMKLKLQIMTEKK